VGDVALTLGDLTVPCLMLVLGANLARGGVLCWGMRAGQQQHLRSSSWEASAEGLPHALPKCRPGACGRPPPSHMLDGSKE